MLLSHFKPTEAEEEALRSHFASCGEIESVRIVRDKKMASGKGFGYVNFMVSNTSLYLGHLERHQNVCTTT